MTSCRLLASMLFVLALGIVFAPASVAEDPPSYGAADLVLEEDGLEAPWEIVFDELPGTPGEALEPWVLDVAKACGVSEDDMLCEVRILKGPEDAAATILVAEIDGDPKTLVETLEARGKAQGYVVRALGHPSRVLVLAAPEAFRDKLLKLQTEYAVSSLTKQGWERFQQKSMVGAATFAKGARKMDPKAGAPMVLLGMVATNQGQFDEAIEAFRVGFGKGVTVPAEGRFAMRGYAHYGYACLEKKGEHFKEGREAFQKCVELESEGDPKEDPLFIQRYNLACAHARLKEVDQALMQLELSLEMGRKSGKITNLAGWVQQKVMTDEHFASLKDHPGFKAIVERAMAGGGSGIPDGGM